MRLRYAALFLLSLGTLLATAALIVSCTPDKSAPLFNAEAAEVAVLPLENGDALLTSVSQTELAAFTDSACLDCHTNQARLEELALPPSDDDHESLSSGPG